ncbi:hypothetical protein V2O64_10420 [Verrucomicrobiaceae bacterium 227]
MSDETPQTPDDNGALDLSGLNFGPAWARDPSESKSLKKFKDRGDRGDRNDSRGRGDRNDRRGGGGGGFRDNRGGGGGDRRGGGGGFRGQGGGQGRRDFENRAPRQEVEPPEGFKIQLMPAEESLDLLARQVIDTGRTYSVFDLAKVLLQSRDRFRVIFESSGQKFFRCREDQSLWLTRDEALRHLWKSDWLSKFYEEVKVEGEAPKGSFSSIARCGISGELLGPPNYHGYQEKLIALHRERFSNMSLDAYKAKVRTERGEEAVEAWLESMKQVTKWKAKSGEEPPVVEAAPAAETPAAEEAPAEVSVEAEAPVAEEAAPEVEAAETPVEATPADESGEESAEPEAAAAEEPAGEVDAAELLDDARALERHFAENHFAKVFEETDRAWVIGDIKGNLLSPGFLTLLKRCVAEEKRYPSNLMPLVCRQLSGRHVAVFKWDKKLKVGPSRPHAVSSGTPLAERPQAMIKYLGENSGAVLKDFWEAVRPADVSDAAKHDWLQDFQWLLSQGHIILLSDTTVHLAKKSDGAQSSKKAAKKGAGKAAKPAGGAPRKPAAEAPKEVAAEAPAEAPKEPAVETPKAEAAAEPAAVEPTPVEPVAAETPPAEVTEAPVVETKDAPETEAPAAGAPREEKAD